jgi:hypothetical protein
MRRSLRTSIAAMRQGSASRRTARVAPQHGADTAHVRGILDHAEGRRLSVRVQCRRLWRSRRSRCSRAVAAGSCGSPSYSDRLIQQPHRRDSPEASQAQRENYWRWVVAGRESVGWRSSTSVKWWAEGCEYRRRRGTPDPTRRRRKTPWTKTGPNVAEEGRSVWPCVCGSLGVGVLLKSRSQGKSRPIHLR